MVVHDEINRFLEYLDYPRGDARPDGKGGVVVKFDGAEMRVGVENGRLTFVYPLGRPEASELVQLAGYAAGRVLKEDAILAWDPERGEPFLWQDVSASADVSLQRQVFEVFLSSCDWWRDRIGAPKRSRSSIPEMLIRP